MRLASYLLLFLSVQGFHSYAFAQVRTQTETLRDEKDKASLIRIGLMQAIPKANNQSLNLKIAENYCVEAAEQGADLLLMPEMWNIGYRGFGVFDEQTTKEWQSQAVATDGPWVEHFCKLSKKLKMAIAVTYLQEWQRKPRNVVSVIDNNGDIVLTYAKVHTCDFAFEAALTPGDEWPVVDLELNGNSVKVGAMICFDREFPESARSLMLAGAEVIVTPNACLLDPLRISQFRVRAYENSVVMAMANYPEPQNNGHSIVVDSTGNIITEANEKEGLYFADIDINSLREWRSRSLWGNAWRRPGQYGSLTKKVDIDVFERKDAYGKDFNSSSQ